MSNSIDMTDPLTRTNERLRRMGSAINSNHLSGSAVQSTQGKALLEHMLTSVAADDFDPDATRKLITDRLAAGMKL